MRTVPGKISRANKKGRRPIVAAKPEEPKPTPAPKAPPKHIPRGRLGTRKKTS
jgi:hypothetical protein